MSFRPLFGDKLYPLTKCIGYLACETGHAADVFRGWQKGLDHVRGTRFESRGVVGDLAELLRQLIPLTTLDHVRHVFVPTKSQWTAVFDNGARGGDPLSYVPYLCRVIPCRGVSIRVVPHTMREAGAGGWTGEYGATTWEVYAAEEREFLNYERTLNAMNDGGKWVFRQTGVPYPFEKPDHYTRRPIRERFTPELLAEYAGHLGIRAFDETFYFADERQPAILFTRTGPQEAGEALSLEEARRRLGCEESPL